MDVVEFDLTTGSRTNLPAAAHRVLTAFFAADVPFAVVGAIALGVRGLPRFTRRLDLIVASEHEIAARALLVAAKAGDEVDVLVASGEPESSVIAEASDADTFGVRVPVATLEHLVLMYLYSNQPRHFADLARIVTEAKPDLG